MTPRDRLPAQDARGLSLEFRQMRREHKPCLDGGAEGMTIDFFEWVG